MRACVVHHWADGSCGGVSQDPYHFTTIVAQYSG
jgi:hypothetical protein